MRGDKYILGGGQFVCQRTPKLTHEICEAQTWHRIWLVCATEAAGLEFFERIPDVPRFFVGKRTEFEQVQ